MGNEIITILGVSMDRERFPMLFDWAKQNKEGLEKRILDDIKEGEKPETLLTWLEYDLKEQNLK